MNRSKIKNYAPQARRDFLQAVTDRAAFYGLTEKRTEPVTVQGDVALIAGRAFPKEVAEKRRRLEERVGRDGFGPTMEALAYTWFNRLVAIRYMELHGYLDHGYRVLSHPDSAAAMPEILEHAEHVELPDLNRDQVIALKLDGAREAELYRLLLVAQCNALHAAMPFLFDPIGDEAELVLPEGLLHSDSIVRKLVSGVDEEDWQEVEIVGWLYQFYISDKKAEVMGKTVASEDIPAATQLFTPKWIVRYLVQNTLGQFWLSTYPQSPLKGQMKYYIEPAEQTPEVQEHLQTITPTSLNPEDVTFLDPACGSAHILVEAYDLFKAIYQERGYRARDIPRLILGKNLFGLEIDDRATQLAAFALMMKARADDRRIFEQGIQPQVRALVQTEGMDSEDIAAALNLSDMKQTPPPGQLFETEDNLFTRSASTTVRLPYTSLTDVAALVDLFQNAKTLGSLIQVPPALATRLPQIEQQCREVAGQSSEIASRTAARFLPVIEQSKLLVAHYSCVVTNPPYMGNKGMNPLLKSTILADYPDGKTDLFAAFMQRAAALVVRSGFLGLMTPFTWMFIKSYEGLRLWLLEQYCVKSLVRPEYHAFFDSAFVPICAFVAQATNKQGVADFIDLNAFYGEEAQPAKALEAINDGNCEWRFRVSTSQFQKIPGSPFVYQLPQRLLEAFDQSPLISAVADVKEGLNTGDNDRFFRHWAEVSYSRIGFGVEDHRQAIESRRKWFPCNKGGPFRKWYGNNDHVINWENNGSDLKSFRDDNGRIVSAIRNVSYYFKEGLTWSGVGSSGFSVRSFEKGYIFNSVGRSLFPHSNRNFILGYLNSSVCSKLLKELAPTLHFSVGDVANLPSPQPIQTCVQSVEAAVGTLVKIAKQDWDDNEFAFSFSRFPLQPDSTLEAAWLARQRACNRRVEETKALEESVNQTMIELFGVEGVVSACVKESNIVLYRPNREEDIKRLISYAVGCTMGRYSLDQPGLVYAHGGNVGFDPGQYRTFPADPDGIVPVMEADWFADDAAHRFVEFLGVAWPREHLEENLAFVADALGPSRGEQLRDTIRRYLATGFYKHHLQIYKRRPIYWLFSSGKQRAFQCLVYLHRYHEGTLSRMRTEYVIPLQGKLASRIDQLAGDIPRATSTSHRTALTRERDRLLKQQAELQAYDEKLRHHADMRIALDLDDGVKVNYGKFGDLLAEVKAVTGGREED